MNQLRLFPQPTRIEVPDVIRQALEQGATMAISVSGGKDSHALLIELTRWFRAEGFGGQLLAIHADLGRAEWPQTPEFVERICRENNVPLVVVRRPKGDMVSRFEERAAKLAHSRKPFWASKQNRYCTSDMKRGPIDTALRRMGSLVVSAEGVRGDESDDRAKKPLAEIRPGITATSKRPHLNLGRMSMSDALACRGPRQRVALNWRPLLYWNEEQVWQSIGTSTAELRKRQAMYRLGEHEKALQGWPAHVAYVLGNSRLSCALCVLGSKNDLLNGANHNPELYAHYLRLEREGGATFKNGWSLSDLPVTGEAARLRDEVINNSTEK